MGEYKPRLTRPEPGNKYYITRSAGGYSNAILGNPKYRDKISNVLPNCVGYAVGRFNEIGGYNYIKWLTPSNAERFIYYAQKQGLEITQKPSLGACMVWASGSIQTGNDGAGHVAIVEEILSDTKVRTSESGWYSATPFWTQVREKGSNGNWGERASSYQFLGFIKNPAVETLPSGVKWVTMEVKGKGKVEVPAINLNGNWYVKLRAIDDIMGVASVSYNEKEKLPTIIDE